jgi:hypothetical protein
MLLAFLFLVLFKRSWDHFFLYQKKKKNRQYMIIYHLEENIMPSKF